MVMDDGTVADCMAGQLCLIEGYQVSEKQVISLGIHARDRYNLIQSMECSQHFQVTGSLSNTRDKAADIFHMFSVNVLKPYT